MELPAEIPQHPSAWTWTRFTEALARRRGWAGAPALAIFTLGAAGAFWWPDTYVSTAVMRIVPPATSDRIYPEIARQSLADRLTAFQQSVLSRQNLSAMVDRLRLYRDERARMPLEDVIEKMRRDIEIVPVSASGNAAASRNPVFRVSFAYTNRLDAERVTRTLMSGILDESQRENVRRLDSVLQFVTSEHDRALLEVEAAEAKLAAFRRAGGKGPDQAGLRLHQLALLEARGSAAEAGLGRARQEQALLEADAQLARALRPAPAQAAAPAASPAPAPPSMLEQLEAERKRLLIALSRVAS